MPAPTQMIVSQFAMSSSGSNESAVKPMNFVRISLTGKETSSCISSISAFLPTGAYFEGAGADGADLRAEHGDGYDGHDLAAGSGLDKLNVGSLGVIDELGRVAGAAGLEPGSKARGKSRACWSPPTKTAEGLYLRQRTVKRLV